MAAKDLITLARAYQDLQGVSSQDSLLSTLVTAVSEAIEKYCKRTFVSKSWDELYNGNGDRRLYLRQYPVQSVQSVRYRPVTVLRIQNQNTTLNQRATVAITSAGLTLTTVASGVVTTSTSVTWAGNPTIQGVASAVQALSADWIAQATGLSTGDYGLFPSADLYVGPSYGDGTQGQGALTCRGNYAELKLHTSELQGYQWDARGWLLRAIPYTDPELLHPEDLIWPVGINNFRVQYTAGYTTVPEAVQEACARWVAILYYETQRDPLLNILKVSGAIAQRWQPQVGNAPPAEVRALLAPYRRHTVSTNQG